MREVAGAWGVVLGVPLSVLGPAPGGSLPSRGPAPFTGWSRDGSMALGGVVPVIAGSFLWTLATTVASKEK